MRIRPDEGPERDGGDALCGLATIPGDDSTMAEGQDNGSRVIASPYSEDDPRRRWLGGEGQTMDGAAGTDGGAHRSHSNDDLVIAYGLVQQWWAAVEIQRHRVEDEDALADVRVVDSDLLALAIYQLERSLRAIDKPFVGDLSATLALRHALVHPDERDPDLLYTVNGRDVTVEGSVLGPYGKGPTRRIVSRLVKEAGAIAEHAAPLAEDVWDI